MFTANLRIGLKCDLTDFNHGNFTHSHQCCSNWCDMVVQWLALSPHIDSGFSPESWAQGHHTE